MPDKKNFCVNGKTFTYVDGSRAYLEHYTPGPGGLPVRRRVYGRLSAIKNKVGREAAALALAESLASAPAGAKPVPAMAAAPSRLEKALADDKIFMRLKTWQSTKSRLKFFRAWLDGRSEEIDTDTANEFLRFLLASGKSPATVVSYKVSLSGLYRKTGLSNPWPGAVRIKKQSSSLLYFSTSQADRLRAVLQKDFPAVWLAARLLFSCFIRPGELRLLPVGAYDLERGTVEIPANISKNGKRARVVIPAGLLLQLREDERFRKPAGWYLFGRRGAPGKIPVGKNWLNSQHAAALAAAGIFGRYAFYSWKHTGVVRAVRAGINLKDLQLQLRHHSLDMVNEYLKELGVMDSQDLKNRFPVL